MKLSKFKEEIASLGHDELAMYLERLRKELFTLRLHAVSQPIKDATQFKKLRRNIARVITRMNSASQG